MNAAASAYGGRPGLGPSPTSPDIPYGGGPYGAARPLHTSPPSSQHPSSSTDMSRPSAASSHGRPPSSTSSLGMSNDGRIPMGRPPPSNRDSTKSTFKPEGEDALQRHYGALKRYLASHLQDEKGNMRPNRARDKLLRLSATQFMELSTDVYDELMRREDDRTQRIENVPRFLPPRQNFHPKRNQARQKLSTLPIERFRQLATDVFYELERRIPRFAGDSIGRPMSTNSNASSRSRAPSRGGQRPFPPPAGRGRMGPPMPPHSPYGGSFGNTSPGGMGGSRRPSEAGSMGRPLPKTLQSSTMVPNKSTMIEDDDPEDEEDAYGYGKGGSAADRERTEAQEMEIEELKAKLSEKDQEHEEWQNAREDLEQRNMDLQRELDELKSKNGAGDLDDLTRQIEERRHSRDQLAAQLHDLQSRVNDFPNQHRVLLQELDQHLREKEDLHRQLLRHAGSSSSEEYEQKITELEEEAARQETMMNQVRDEAMNYLREMRDLSKQNDAAIEAEEKLAAKVAQQERDIADWRQRYAKLKSQNRSLRASTMGLGLFSSKSSAHDAGSLVRQEGLISEGGLVRDTDVTRFQLAIDDLLHAARDTSTDTLLSSVKNVVICVQAITANVGTDGYPTPSPSPLGNDETNKNRSPPSVGKLKAQVTGTANSLITAAKQHAASHGLAPITLLDAAASHLTASVVALIKAVRIRPSDTADADATADLNDYYDDHDVDDHHHHDHDHLHAASDNVSSHHVESNGSAYSREIASMRATRIEDRQVSTVSSMGTGGVENGSGLKRTLTSGKKTGGWFGWAGKATETDDEGEENFR